MRQMRPLNFKINGVKHAMEICTNHELCLLFWGNIFPVVSGDLKNILEFV